MAVPESPYTYGFDQPRQSLGFNPIDALVNVLKGASRPFTRADEYHHTMQNLRSSGISTEGPRHGNWWGSDADRLAQLTVHKPYNTDPRVQAQYLALLKQLGYLRNQAF